MNSQREIYIAVRKRLQERGFGNEHGKYYRLPELCMACCDVVTQLLKTYKDDNKTQ